MLLSNVNSTSISFISRLCFSIFSWHLAIAPGGERRRVEIARALTLKPHFILLDEPFSGIDPIAVNDIQAMVQALREQGYGVLITDHNVRETLSITDRTYLIHDGKIFLNGSPEEVAADPMARKFYLGDHFSW